MDQVTYADIVKRENIGNLTLRHEYAEAIRDTGPERVYHIRLALEWKNSYSSRFLKLYISLN